MSLSFLSFAATAALLGQDAQPERPWTLLVYGAADNNGDGPILHFLDGVRAALAKSDAFSPGFVKSRRNWQPYADRASNERLQEGLSGIEG